MKYSEEQIEDLKKHYLEINPTYVALQFKLQEIAKFLKSDISKEYITQGIGRRLNIIKTSAANVFKYYPPNLKTIISDENRLNTEINLQSFMINIYGCIENFAKILAEEKKLQYTNPKQISFENKDLQKLLSDEFNAYIKHEDHIKWTEYFKNFRHSLCHRIPFYIPPYSIDPKDAEKFKNMFNERLKAIMSGDITKIHELDEIEKDLCENFPIITHSFIEESSLVLFHGQVISDWLKIAEFSEKVILELK